jgi:hypothetical protein
LQNEKSRQGDASSGSVASKLYLAFRRITFREQITRVEDSGRHLGIVTDIFATKGSLFVPFPDLLIPSKKDKDMVLCASRCASFVGHIKKVIEMVLKGNS